MTPDNTEERIALVGMALCQEALGGKRCPCVEAGAFRCADELPGNMARVAIEALTPDAAMVGDEAWDEAVTEYQRCRAYADSNSKVLAAVKAIVAKAPK